MLVEVEANMLRNPSLALLLCILSSIPASAAEHRVLFVGNSYSFANSAQGLAVGFEALLQEVGGSAEAELVAKGGWTLHKHFQDAQTEGEQLHALLGKGEQTWTAVVLQEQSQIPAWHDQLVQDWYDSLNGAQGLNGMVEAAGAQTVFLMTWGRREGDSGAPELFPDYMTMQSALAEGYGKYAELLSTSDRPVLIAPAGLAFQTIWEDAVAEGKDPLDPEGIFWRLYTSDGSHPSQLGSYLATLVVFTTLTANDPETTTWLPTGVKEEEAEYLRSVARRTVLGEEDPVPSEPDMPDVVSQPDVPPVADLPVVQPDMGGKPETLPETVTPRADAGERAADFSVEALRKRADVPPEEAGSTVAESTGQNSPKKSSGCQHGTEPAIPVALLFLLLLLGSYRAHRIGRR